MAALILIPAAGASARMRGGDKLMEPVAGEPLLRRQARMALAAGPVEVTLPASHPARAEVLAGLGLDVTVLPDAAEGMAASIRHGARRAMARAASGLLILPADMPDLDSDHLCLILAAHAATPDRPLRGAAEDGTPGHPVLFPRRLFPDLLELSGDSGGRAVLTRHPATAIPLPGRAALTDLDTPEDWAAWRARI